MESQSNSVEVENVIGNVIENSIDNEVNQKINSQNHSPQTANSQIRLNAVITMFDIKSNRNYEYVIETNTKNITLTINVFDLLKYHINNQHFELLIDNLIYILKPNVIIPNAIITKEGDIFIIKYSYEYDKQYKNYNISLESLGFDCILKLIDCEYTNLYSFQNGEFRIDLEITLK